MKRKIISSIIILILIYVTLGIKPINAESIKTMKIVIDPGHGGYETGAINYDDGVLEKDITLKTSRYLKEYLEDYYGVQIIMTHNGLDNNTEMSIVDRGMVARNNNADLLMCLHFNSSTSNELHGAEVFVTNNKSCYKYNEESTEVGNLILSNLSKLGIYNRGVKTKLCNDEGPKWEYSDGSKADYYGIIRYAMKGNSEDRGLDITKGVGITSILVEHCFIKGEDVKFINTDAKLKQLAEADGKAIVDHYGLKLKKDVVSEVILNAKNIDMIVGEERKINVSVNPTTAQNKKINWTSSNSKVAVVDQNGNITAIGAGKTVITAIADGNDRVLSRLNVTVKDIDISIQNGNSSMLVNGTMQFYTDTQVTDSSISWKSSDESIAIVDQNGLVKGVKEGTANITVSLEKYNRKDTITLKVNKLREGEKIEIINYKEKDGVISNFERETLKNSFEKNIKVSGNLKVKVNTDKIIGTNTRVEILRENEVVQTYICKLYGDINGDGKISAMDYMLIKNKIMEVKDITGTIEKDVADVNKDGKISSLDYMLIKNDILDVKKVSIR